MSNLQNYSMQSFDKQVEQFTRGLVNVITALAPLVLILVILGIAGANAYVEYLYQIAIFGKEYALYPAVLVAGLRFASGMGGITLIKTRRYITGIFFVAVSLALTWYTWQHVGTIAEGIAPAAVIQAEFTISMILWGGFVGELMIAGYMAATGGMAPSDQGDQDQDQDKDKDTAGAVNWIPAAVKKENGLHLGNLGNGQSSNGNGRQK